MNTELCLRGNYNPVGSMWMPSENGRAGDDLVVVIDIGKDDFAA